MSNKPVWNPPDSSVGRFKQTSYVMQPAYSLDGDRNAGVEVMGTLRSGASMSGSAEAAVCHLDGIKWVTRRIMPVEGERLMGVPDGWTDVPGVSKTARYKLLGNGFAVPVVRWIGERIEMALRHEEEL